MLTQKKSAEIYTSYLDALEASMSNPRHSVSDRELDDLVRGGRISEDQADEYSWHRDLAEIARRQLDRESHGDA